MNTKASNIQILCERFLKTIQDHNWGDIAEGLEVTNSIGLTDLASNDTDAAMLTKAKSNLSQAKQAGGNRYVVD